MNLQQALSFRSQLFIPALSTQFVEKAHTRGADAIIVDLEDAIAPQSKDEARRALPGVVESIAARGMPVFVRVNNDRPLLAQDLEAAQASAATGILLPKAEDPAQVRQVAERMDASGKSLALLLESPMAMLRAAELAQCSDRVVALAFGSEDYCTCMGVRPTIEAMRAPAYSLALAARAWGRAAWGVVGSIAEIADLGHFGQMAAVARDLGYTGALAIHPRQVPVLNEAFGASQEELAEAASIVEAFDKAVEAGRGAVQHNGRMLDKPIVDRARALLVKNRYSPAALAG